MNIDQLPIEMLMKIFSYLSRYDEVLLVNKLFYRVACRINDPNICLRLDDHFFENNWMPSIEISTRQISKLDINIHRTDDATCRALISIIAKMGELIKCLKITIARATMEEFLEILSLIPNVEHLVIECLRLRMRDQPVLKLRKIIGSNDLNLHRLKKFRFRRSIPDEKDKFLSVFDRLPVRVLTELDLSRFTLQEVVILLKRQTSITKLAVKDFDFSSTDSVHVFDNLQLDSLEMSFYTVRGDITALLSKQTQLKTLTISDSHAGEDLLNFVGSHFTKLESLSISTEPLRSYSSIANLGKIKKLKELSVLLYRTAAIELTPLANYPNLGITSLTIGVDSLDCNLVPLLATSLTKLKVLKLSGCGNYAAIIKSIMTNFNFVEVLHISEYLGGCNELSDDDFYNPKLTELSASFSKIIPSELIAHYPNLKKLKIHWGLVTRSQFRQVLNGFTKLESLTFIDTAQRLTVDDLNYLKEHKNNLKFVWLGGMRVRFTDELKRHLSTVFGAIFCNKDTRAMAVDRYTMNRERKSQGSGVLAPVFC